MAILDHQHDMAGLKTSYNFMPEERNTRKDEMWKTGQVPMEVNAMPGLISDESEREESYENVIAMQSGDFCFLCKLSGHLKKDCRKFKEWRNKNLANVSCYTCGKQPITQEIAKRNQGNHGG